MLKWRLILGVLIIAALVALCWLDHLAARPGVWLMPVAVVLAVLASGEILWLCRSAGLKPIGPVVYLTNVLLVLSPWLVTSGSILAEKVDGGAWPMMILAAGVLLAFLGEMRRYDRSKGVTSNLGATVLSMVYVGLMLAVVVQLRLAWGIGALASLVIVVKMGDTGAYTVGRLIGRHKMTPVLSPGKTIEGAMGAVAFSTLGAWASFTWLVPWLSGAGVGSTPWWGWALFGVVVGLSGMFADLAESLLKRDAECKDSSNWLPGFGGVLDILDSILLASPVVYIFWGVGLVK
ncbi:MAG: phosphatidate cytidylyltransferase [Planctomycetota bacterium]|nr:phosphatidate cytidylyltransferase [Planctomycetota bacterium]